LLGPPTLAVGTTLVGGGVRSVAMEAGGPVVDRQGVNSIPNWCEATIDVRHPPSWDMSILETACFILEAIQHHLERVMAPRGWFFEVDLLPHGVTPPVALAPTVEQAADLPMVLLARRRAEQVLGYRPDLETAPGGTNATFMVHEGRIQTLVEMGPGGGLSHDANEFVDVEDVIDGAKLLALLAIDLVGVE
jgi:acetylornithine deacetylase/succinyl-diaminopimelate desuccinylase-like protein